MLYQPVPVSRDWCWGSQKQCDATSGDLCALGEGEKVAPRSYNLPPPPQRHGNVNSLFRLVNRQSVTGECKRLCLVVVLVPILVAFFGT